MKLIKWGTVILILILSQVITSTLMAAEVGRVVQLEGTVDILRGGKLPATTAKLNDAINPGDIVRTKSLSSAEIKFIDDSTITIAPGSRVAIEDYMYDADKGQRQATLQMFMGMVHTVVKKIHQVKEPDFTIKTHTAIIGVRGTDWYTVGPPYVMPTVTDIYNGSGETDVRNSFAEVPGTVTLKGMAVSRVAANLPPTLPMPIEAEDLKILKNQLAPQPKGKAMCPPAGVTACQPADSKPAALIAKGNTVTNVATTEAINTITNLNQLANQNSMVQNLNSALYVPPMTPTPSTNVTQTQPSPSPNVQSFTQTYSGLITYTLTSAPPQNIGVYNIATTLGSFGVRTGVYPGAFLAAINLIATAPSSGAFNPSVSGTITISNNIGNVTGSPGQTMTGDMRALLTTSGGTTFNLSGPVSIQPSGNLTSNPTGTFTLGGTTGTVTGTWTQTPK